MLTFRSVSLTDVAPVWVSDIIVGAPSIITSSREKAAANGEYFARRKYSPRRVTVRFYFHPSTNSKRAEWIQSIYDWAHSEGEEELRVPHKPGMYLMATCTGLPDFSATEYGQMIEVEFTAHDPAFVEDVENVTPCGVAFEVRGSLPASGYIEVTNAAPVTDPEWTLDAGDSIALDGEVSAGTIHVDLSPIYASLDGSSIMDQVTLQSRSLLLDKGIHTIAGDGSLRWHERWL